MDYRINKKEGKKYVEVISAPSPMGSVDDALDLVALVGENDTNLLMLHSSALADDFFRLKTQIAGEMLQKFINYYIKTAVVVPEQITNNERFSELASESNKGNHFGVFFSQEAAEKWLLS